MKSETTTFFRHNKKTIVDNAMNDSNSKLQYHITIDVNEIEFEICLFQLHKIFSNTKTIFKILFNERIIVFLFFKFNDVEIKYFNTERECYAIIRNLTDVK